MTKNFYFSLPICTVATTKKPQRDYELDDVHSKMQTYCERETNLKIQSDKKICKMLISAKNRRLNQHRLGHCKMHSVDV